MKKRSCGLSARRLATGLAVAMAVALWGGCAPALSVTCPACAALPTARIAPEARVVYVLVPGILGYGWEWDGVPEALAGPAAQVAVLPWEPWATLPGVARAVRRELAELLRRAPRVRRVVVLAHSAGGLVAWLGAYDLALPAGVELQVVTVGAPLAGLGMNPSGSADLTTLVPLMLGGRLPRLPAALPGIGLEVYVTDRTDPVMRRRGGHDPGDRRVLPAGAVVRALPPGVDHNHALRWVARRLVARATGSS